MPKGGDEGATRYFCTNPWHSPAPSEPRIKRAKAPPERKMVREAVEGLVQLREAVATHLRYLDGEVVDGLRTGRHTREVVANIAEHQSRNLRAEVERTGSLTRDGRAGRAVTTPPRPPAPSNQGEGECICKPHPDCRIHGTEWTCEGCKQTHGPAFNWCPVCALDKQDDFARAALTPDPDQGTNRDA